MGILEEEFRFDYIMVDSFLRRLEKLYTDNGWKEDEVHFSLRDVKLNIDAEMSEMARCVKLLLGEL